ncbi:MAG: M56 family metallopeptidase [Candidatus Zipacnadales bacterium]
MNVVLAAFILYVATACVTSGVIYVPIAALVEALPRRPALESYAWVGALVTPHLVAALAMLYAVRMHNLDPVPWSVRDDGIRHISFWWIVKQPDAAYLITFVGLVGGVALVAGVLRPVFSAVLGWRYTSILRRSSVAVPELGVWLTPLARPWSTCAGFLHTRVYITKGAVELFDSDELAAVIAHEEAHARRRDNLRLLVGQALLGPTIIMPTAHWALRRMRAAIERAADQEVIRTQASEAVLASALVKAGRKLLDFDATPEEQSLRGRIAARYREEFVTERVKALLQSADASAPDPNIRRLGFLVPALVIVILLVTSVGLVPPTVRSLFESLWAALERGR